MFTIDSDDEIEPEVSSSEDEISKPVRGQKKRKSKPMFRMDFEDDDVFGRVRDASGEDDDDETDSGSEGEDDDNDGDSEDEDGFKGLKAAQDNVRQMPHAEQRAERALQKASKKGKQDAQNAAAAASDEMGEEEEAAYFETVVNAQPSSRGGGPDGRGKGSAAETMFSELSLSRPLLRGVEAAGYVTPTPIQAAVIPLAMAGRDVCASAVTGSGKTAAFVLPFLERLLYRRKDVATIRVLIVTPTRELATQIYTVLQKLSQYTDVTSALICGGKKDLKSQESTLRLRPDVVVCTPGRFIDHLRNSHSVNIDDLDVLVLDEVDRLLDLGFQEEVEELVKHCPAGRQTLLFSATMTPKVEDLAKLSLRKPVRVKTASNATTVAPRLVQEFVKVRNDDEQEAIMAALVTRTFNQRCITFFETKKSTHRFYVILNLLGVKVSELHGDVSQTQRYLALDQFRKGEVDVMVATDVAARGLDIPGVLTVINAEMPRQASTYIHRVGRTARAGCGGRSITLVSDARRKVMKEVLKNDSGPATLAKDGSATSNPQVLSRTVPATVVTQFVSKIASLEGRIVEFMSKERMQAKLREAEDEVARAENMLVYEAEIAARPARTWYQTETEKEKLREVGREEVKKLEEKIAPKTSARELTADEKMRRMARSDDYRMDDKAEGKKDKSLDHRLSRRKKRRLEALKELAEDKDNSVNMAPKRAKAALKTTKQNMQDRSLSDLDKGVNGQKKISVVSSETGKKKVLRQRFAVGGLDSEWLDDTGSAGGMMNKKLMKVMNRKAEKDFTEFDPTKRLKKGGKTGHSTFKSKSKFKRKH